MAQGPNKLESKAERGNEFRIIYFRIPEEHFREMRKIIIYHERETGERMNQQDVLSAALAAYLAQKHR